MSIKFENAELIINLGECKTPTGNMGFRFKLEISGMGLVQIYKRYEGSEIKNVIWELDQSDLNKIENILEEIKKISAELKKDNKLQAITHTDKNIIK